MPSPSARYMAEHMNPEVLDTFTLDGHLCTITRWSVIGGIYYDVTTPYNGREAVMGTGLTRDMAVESARRGLATYFGPAR